MEFRTIVADKKFDILFAADVVYESEQIEPLISSVIEFMHGICF
jgi:predicted nicotinamide N-methyase